MTGVKKQSAATKTIRVRVPTSYGFVHGEAIGGKITAPDKPSDWTVSTDFIKVAFDIGPVCYVRSRNVKKFTKPNVYERAHADLGAFLNEMLAATHEQRAITLLKISSVSTSWNNYIIETPDGPINFTINADVRRYLHLLNQLEKPEAMQWLLTLIESFVGVDLSEDAEDFDFPVDAEDVFNPKEYWSGYKGSYSDLLTLLLDTIGQLVMKQYHVAPFENLRAGFGDAFADQLSTVLHALGEYCKMQPFLLQAIDALPGAYSADQTHGNPLYSDYRSDQFGIEGEELPVLY